MSARQPYGAPCWAWRRHHRSRRVRSGSGPRGRSCAADAGVEGPLRTSAARVLAGATGASAGWPGPAGAGWTPSSSSAARVGSASTAPNPISHSPCSTSAATDPPSPAEPDPRTCQESLLSTGPARGAVLHRSGFARCLGGSRTVSLMPGIGRDGSKMSGISAVAIEDLVALGMWLVVLAVPVVVRRRQQAARTPGPAVAVGPRPVRSPGYSHRLHPARLPERGAWLKGDHRLADQRRHTGHLVRGMASPARGLRRRTRPDRLGTA
jgi:hypothetical protein